MNVLGFDTTTDACSAAVWCGDGLAAHRFETLRRGHVERLVPMVTDAMAEAGLDFDALDLIAVTTGPGTFTGIRIGLAAARGFGLAASVPVAGMTSLEVLAAAQRSGDQDRGIIAAIDARRGQIYRQVFDVAMVPLEAPCVVAQDAALPWSGRWLAVGSGAFVYAGMADVEVREDSRLPDASVLVELAYRRFGVPGATMPTHYPAPLYLRAPDADLPETSDG
ncbi:MAG: tRNA (adenosine(37)-N6)-threonylcarbamoyltransferase complex dimerization subunit type 1 TsaB [Pseudomonadota bacterium]